MRNHQYILCVMLDIVPKGNNISKPSWLLLMFAYLQPGSHNAAFGDCSYGQYISPDNCGSVGSWEKYQKDPDSCWKLHWVCCEPHVLPIQPECPSPCGLRHGCVPHWPCMYQIWDAHGPLQVNLFFCYCCFHCLCVCVCVWRWNACSYMHSCTHSNRHDQQICKGKEL